MFGIGMPELIIIFIVALIIIGPKKLPDLARALGKGIAEFKKATNNIKADFDIGDEFKDVEKDLSDSVTGFIDASIKAGEKEGKTDIVQENNKDKSEEDIKEKKEDDG